MITQKRFCTCRNPFFMSPGCEIQQKKKSLEPRCRKYLDLSNFLSVEIQFKFNYLNFDVYTLEELAHATLVIIICVNMVNVLPFLSDDCNVDTLVNLENAFPHYLHQAGFTTETLF